MPALNFTVNTVTNQLAIVGHSQLTGAGPAATRNVGSALPVPLTPVTDYWLIRDDDNNVRLATSSANALAGIAIDLTTTGVDGSGNGINILEIGIPYRRARTYVPRSVSVAGAQLKSADFNTKMDSLQALHAFLTNQAQSTWFVDRELPLSAAAFRLVSGGTASLDDGRWTFGALSKLVAPVLLPVGARITTVTWKYNRGGAGTITLRLRRNQFDGTSGNVLESSDVTGAAIETNLIAYNHVIASGFAYWLEVQCDSAAHVFYGATLKSDILL